MKYVLQKPADKYDPRGRLDPTGFDQHIDFRTYTPPTDLEPFIEHCWTIHWDGIGAPYISEEVMHRPYVDVFISAQESGIQGTFRDKRAYIAAGSGRIAGIRFRPGAFHILWDGKLVDLQDRIVDVQQVFPELHVDSIARLLACDDHIIVHSFVNLLRTRHPQPDPNIVLIHEIIAAIEADADLQTVTAVAKVLNRSERWLQQLFQDYVGIGLKWFLQRHRLLLAAQQIREAEEPAWAAIAYDLGYSSQQHFITDFRRVLGKTPLQYKQDLTKPG